MSNPIDESSGDTAAAPTDSLAALLGTWIGHGNGVYPTIEPFAYLERLTFSRSPKGFVAYQQFTTHPTSGAAMHTETGYLRAPHGDTALELVVAQPTGIVEVLSGIVRVSGASTTFSLKSDSVTTTSSAKHVDAVTRDYSVVGDELQYEICMAAVGQPLQHHLEGVLTRER
jgi:THAP4-like, heme-binding beta-barrel domain